MTGQHGDKLPGRPRNDDGAYVADIMFQWNITGRPLAMVLHEAADDLVRASQAAADAAATRGERKPVIDFRSAYRRLKAAFETARGGGIGPLTGLPDELRVIGAITGRIARRDGYAAGRHLLVEALGYNLAFGRLRDPAPRDPETGQHRIQSDIVWENTWIMLECRMLADDYISEIEGQCKVATNGENSPEQE
jgi:hypothetical protein